MSAPDASALRKLWWLVTGNYRWRVIYPDGQRSYPMRRLDAKSYRDIFGGRVYRVWPTTTTSEGE